MSCPEYTLRLHIIDDNGGALIDEVWAHSIPSIGDELRLDGPRYCRVTRVVHVYDERELYHRANIGVEVLK